MIIKDSTDEQAPDGQHSGICADVEELGAMVNGFGTTQQKLRLVYLIDKRDKNGRPLRVTELLTASKHPDSKLVSRVQALLGAMPVGDLDTECLVGKSCTITTEQAPNKKGTVFANVLSLKPPKPSQTPVAVPLDFVRAKDRPKQPPGTAPPKRRQ